MITRRFCNTGPAIQGLAALLSPHSPTRIIPSNPRSDSPRRSRPSETPAKPS